MSNVTYYVAGNSQTWAFCYNSISPWIRTRGNRVGFLFSPLCLTTTKRMGENIFSVLPSQDLPVGLVSNTSVSGGKQKRSLRTLYSLVSQQMPIHWLYIYLRFYPQHGVFQWSRLFFLPSPTNHHISRLSENGVCLRTELTGSWHTC